MVLSFKQYLLTEEKATKSLPHITTMSHEDTGNLLKTGKIHFKHVTEKTDGYPMSFGHDERGFYVQNKHAGHEKMRSVEHYKNHALEKEKRTGNKHNPAALKTFQEIHHSLEHNHELRKYLKDKHKETGKEVRIKGEMLHHGSSQPGAHEGERKFVSTSYSTKGHGKIGHFILHSQMEGTKEHKLDHFVKHLSNENITFSHDKIKHAGGHVDVAEEKAKYDKLNHALLSSRTTKTNKEAKLKEQEKLHKIQKSVSTKVDAHLHGQKIANKFGSGTEGHVVHPHGEQPRFKVTSSEFRHVVDNKIKPKFDK